MSILKTTSRRFLGTTPVIRSLGTWTSRVPSMLGTVSLPGTVPDLGGTVLTEWHGPTLRELTC